MGAACSPTGSNRPIQVVGRVISLFVGHWGERTLPLGQSMFKGTGRRWRWVPRLKHLPICSRPSSSAPVLFLECGNDLRHRTCRSIEPRTGGTNAVGLRLRERASSCGFPGRSSGRRARPPRCPGRRRLRRLTRRTHRAPGVAPRDAVVVRNSPQRTVPNLPVSLKEKLLRLQGASQISRKLRKPRAA